MKSSLYRATTMLFMTAFCMLCVVGCRPDGMGDERNKAMTEKQKAIIEEHKQKQDQ